MVSIARNAINTLVTGLPRPVAAAFAAAAGASVGAGSGRNSTLTASAVATVAESTAASKRRIAPGRSTAAGPSLARRLVAAPSSNAPVKPLPIAASVNATSGAPRRTHTSASNRP
jgi:hypothetical protein